MDIYKNTSDPCCFAFCINADDYRILRFALYALKRDPDLNWVFAFGTTNDMGRGIIGRYLGTPILIEYKVVSRGEAGLREMFPLISFFMNAVLH